MLQNALTLAIGGLDTGENGPSKVRQMTNTVCRNIGKGRGAAAAQLFARLPRAVPGALGLVERFDIEPFSDFTTK